ncbi:MAG: hypothetical protein C0404_13270 [Verrucomicrobia bacterium]|nr:hypothetical protein [Verrucomicrobiota bacterium]
MNHQFPIGFWNYVPLEQQDESAVRDWRDAGMTFTMSPGFGAGADDIAGVRKILDRAHEAGIRMILCHADTDWRNLTAKGESVYREEFARAVKELGSHPAVSGFHVGDEPRAEHFEDACRAVRIQKELAPNLQPFLNLLPWHPGADKAVGFGDWGKYLDAYVEKSGVDLLCYDCYSQQNNPTDAWGWDMYFKNLREYEAASKRQGIPWWTTLLSVGHFKYRCPTEDDLRWQLNTAVAHGAKGILWFFFYMRQPHDNYRLAPVDEHWERTETYEWLSRVCRTFLKWTAPTLRELTLNSVSHVGRAWGEVALFTGNGRVQKAASQHKTDLIISEYRHANGSEYVSVVNNSQKESTLAEIVVRGNHPQLYRICWESRELPVSKTGEGGSGSGDDWCLTRPWLAPGQLELYRVEDRK